EFSGMRSNTRNTCSCGICSLTLTGTRSVRSGPISDWNSTAFMVEHLHDSFYHVTPSHVVFPRFGAPGDFCAEPRAYRLSRLSSSAVPHARTVWGSAGVSWHGTFRTRSVCSSKPPATSAVGHDSDRVRGE